MVESEERGHHFEYRHKGSLLAYLCTSIHHRIVDELRKARRRPIPVPLGDHVDTAPSALEVVIEKENRRRYSRAKSLLTDHDRRLITLRLEQRLAYREVAARLGMITGDAARVALRRAMCRLRRKLAQVDSSQTSGYL